MEPRRVLFIPVSSPSGIGEYMRSMVIAKALLLRSPSCEIHFILNDSVSYIKDCPYIVHTCKGSPTQDTSSVNEIINKISPDFVVFDASGRASQFKQAKAVGAKVAFISQHKKKRSRGLKLNRLFNTDIHWVVQSDYCIKPLGLWQRIKLACLNIKAPEHIGPVYDLSSPIVQQKLIEQYGLIKGNFIVFNAGSGGHKVKDKLATDIYYQAAQMLQQITSMKCVVIFGSNYPKKMPSNSDVITIKTIENNNFITLLSNAYSCVVSAGDTLLQCIDLGVPCVASAVSPDQPARLKACNNQNLVLATEPTPERLVEQVQHLMDKEKRSDLIDQMKKKTRGDALTTIVDDITLLFSANK